MKAERINFNRAYEILSKKRPQAAIKKGLFAQKTGVLLPPEIKRYIAAEDGNSGTRMYFSLWKGQLYKTENAIFDAEGAVIGGRSVDYYSGGNWKSAVITDYKLKPGETDFRNPKTKGERKEVYYRTIYNPDGTIQCTEREEHFNRKMETSYIQYRTLPSGYKQPEGSNIIEQMTPDESMTNELLRNQKGDFVQDKDGRYLVRTTVTRDF